jgi:Rha family phage regulatory protein
MSNALTVGFQANAQGFNRITSIQVADLFERNHKDVLKGIASLVRKEDVNERIYAPTSYLDSWNRKQQMYLLTESGFMVLMSPFNLRTKKQKKTRNEILKLFQERSQQLINRNLQLENVVTKRREATQTPPQKTLALFLP